MASLRDRILAATEKLLRQGGRSRISTRAIAKAARCSDGALYKHFESLDDVLLELFKSKLPSFSSLPQLPLLVGARTLQGNLAGLLSSRLEFMRSAMPIWLALENDRGLQKAYSARLQGQGLGPHIPVQAIAAYLRAEQRLGRVDPGANLTATAGLVLAAVAHRAMVKRALHKGVVSPDDQRWARETAGAIVRGLRSRSPKLKQRA